MDEIKNSIIHGDCLDVLEGLYNKHGEFVDLIYLDPPFFSGQNYDIVWGNGAELNAYMDTEMYWAEKEPDPKDVKGMSDKVEAYRKRIEDKVDEEKLEQVIAEYRLDIYKEMFGAITKGSMKGYLNFMRERLWAMKKVLKPTGTIFLHCDWHANHHLRLILDEIFGAKNFLNEIIWIRRAGIKTERKFGNATDSILFYSKSKKYTFNPPMRKLTRTEMLEKFSFKREGGTGRYFVTHPLILAGKSPKKLVFPEKGEITAPSRKRFAWSQDTLNKRLKENPKLIYWTKNGVPRKKKYLEEYLSKDGGEIIANFWNDILRIQSQSAERLGYPTQKPRALLERIILAATNKGDVVLDPFVGGGTTCVVAEKLKHKRKWIGIDISPRACDMVLKYLEKCDVDTSKIKKDYKWKIEKDLRERRDFVTATWQEAEDFAREVLEFRWIEDKCRSMGIDGIHEDNPKHFLEVKKWQTSVGPAEIKKLYGSIKQYNGEEGTIVADHYTKGVNESLKEFAKKGIVIHKITFDDLLKSIEGTKFENFKRGEIKTKTHDDWDPKKGLPTAKVIGEE